MVHARRGLEVFEALSFGTMSAVPATSARRRLTLEDIRERLEQEEAIELIDGEVIQKAMGNPEHGTYQTKLVAVLDPFNRKPGGPRGPGGWWLMTEVDVLFEKNGDVYRPDAMGFRRDLHPVRPTGFPLRVRPDWVCEVLSPSNARYDVVKKQRTLHQHGVPHYWLLDSTNRTLTVLRHTPDAYAIALTAGVGEIIRAEPFDAIEIETDELFGET